MLHDFLFELGCEELPSAFVKPLGDALGEQLAFQLQKANIPFAQIRTFATPRRLAVLVKGLPEIQQPLPFTKRGPTLSAAYDSTGKATNALVGFAKSCSVSIEDLTTLKTDKGEWMVYETQPAPIQTTQLLPEMLSTALAALPIAKPMRYATGEFSFARPVHWLVCLWDNDLVETTLFGITSNRYTYGHRFHHPDRISLSDPSEYEAALLEANVIADFEIRRNKIKALLLASAKENDATVILSEALLDEVCSIVEWPVPVVSSFSEKFLKLPAESIIAVIQGHQKCFALKDSSDNLKPLFITMANIDSQNINQIRIGNERVMRARLEDALFFYQQDTKNPLSHFINNTKQVIFQKQLGTLYEKTIRIKTFSLMIASELDLNETEVIQGALLSKCDLMTGMVLEFPELQGLMGYYYALASHEPSSVALALKEQYFPRFSADLLPSSMLGTALSLADRLDTLVGIFSLGQKPSGVKDPFKLRRHALAVVRLLLNISQPISLSQLINNTLSTYRELFAANPKVFISVSELTPTLLTFIWERAFSHYQANGFSHDVFEAVKSLQSDCLYDFSARMSAIADFKNSPEAEILTQSCKRVSHLLHHSNQLLDAENVKSALLIEPAERALYDILQSTHGYISRLLLERNYRDTLKALMSLCQPIEVFFDSVMVMSENADVQYNRLCLLQQLKNTLNSVASIDLLQR